MLVLDASAVLEVIVESEIGARWRDRVMGTEEALCAPYLIDIEVLSGLRRLARVRSALAPRVDQAVENFLGLRLRRYAHLVLLPRIWQLRQNFSSYDATYIALAEALDAPLLTRDARLGRGGGHKAKIELLT